jgi:hypothetical protein
MLRPMNILPFLLQVLALVCLLFATFGMFPTSKVSWLPAGMFLWLLSLMVSGIVLHPISH